MHVCVYESDLSCSAAATESGSATAQNVTVGESHTFTCVFLGFPPPTMSWAFNGRPIADGATFVTEQQAQIESRGVIMTRSHLSFTVHSTMFTGRYKCMAAGDAREYQLHVQGMEHEDCTVVSPLCLLQFQQKFW